MRKGLVMQMKEQNIQLVPPQLIRVPRAPAGGKPSPPVPPLPVIIRSAAEAAFNWLLLDVALPCLLCLPCEGEESSITVRRMS